MVEYLTVKYGDKDLRSKIKNLLLSSASNLWFVTEQHCPSVDTHRTAPVQLMETQENRVCVYFTLI